MSSSWSKHIPGRSRPGRPATAGPSRPVATGPSRPVATGPRSSPTGPINSQGKPPRSPINPRRNVTGRIASEGIASAPRNRGGKKTRKIKRKIQR